MASKTYRAGQEAELDRDLKTFARRLMVYFHQEMHAEGREFMERITPEDTGTMKGRWGDRINGRDQVPSDGPHANTRRIKLRTKSAVINDDAGAAAIDYGRKRNHYKGFSRMGGSPQAPNGISRPGKRHVLGYQQRAARIATDRTEREFGR